MIVKCCECGRIIGEKAPLEDKRISHTYCRQCAAEAIKAIRKPSIQEVKHG